MEPHGFGGRITNMKMSKTGALLLIFAAVVSTVTFDVNPAAACSCPDLTSQEALESAEAAFIGVATEVVGDVNDSRAIVRFEVVERIKGVAGEEAYLLAMTEPDDCSSPAFVSGPMFGVEAGVRVFNTDQHPRVGEACTSLEADYLRAGRPGLDPPQAQIAAQAVEYGNHRGTSLRLLGDEGSVAAYLPGNRTILDAALCRDGLTLAILLEDGSGGAVQWVNLESVEVSSEVNVDPSGSDRWRPTIRSCADNHRVLLSNGLELLIVDTDGSVTSRDAGEGLSGDLSPDGTRLATWSELLHFEIEVLGAEEPPTTGVVSNHRSWRLAVSPDNTMIAVVKRVAPDALELVVADTDGNERAISLSGLRFTEDSPVWLDDATVALGLATVDTSSDELALTLQNVAGAQPIGETQPSARAVAIRSDSTAAVVDLRSGEIVEIGKYPARQNIIALPAPLNVEEIGFQPGPRPDLPLPGGAVPGSADELLTLLEKSPNAPELYDLDFLRSPTDRSANEAASETLSNEPADNDPGRRVGSAVVILGLVGAILASITLTKRRRS